MFHGHFFSVDILEDGQHVKITWANGHEEVYDGFTMEQHRDIERRGSLTDFGLYATGAGVLKMLFIQGANPSREVPFGAEVDDTKSPLALTHVICDTPDTDGKIAESITVSLVDEEGHPIVREQDLRHARSVRLKQGGNTIDTPADVANQEMRRILRIMFVQDEAVLDEFLQAWFAPTRQRILEASGILMSGRQ